MKKQPLVVSKLQHLDMLGYATGDKFFAMKFLPILIADTVQTVLNSLVNNSVVFSPDAFERSKFSGDFIRCNQQRFNERALEVIEHLENHLFREIKAYVKEASYEFGYGVFEVEDLPRHNILAIRYVEDYRILEWKQMSSEFSPIIDDIDDCGVDAEPKECISSLRAELTTTLDKISQYTDILTNYHPSYIYKPRQVELKIGDVDYLKDLCGLDKPHPLYSTSFYDIVGKSLRADEIEYCVDANEDEMGIFEITTRAAIFLIEDEDTLKLIADFLSVIDSEITIRLEKQP